MFTFTRKIEYTLVALAHLAKNRCEKAKPTSARAIADQYGLPGSLLMNLMKSLQKAGIVSSTRGANGGYFLPHPPRQVKLVSIIEAVEGPIGLTPCCVEEDFRPAHKQQCEVNECPMRRPMHQLHLRMVGFLEQVTLQDLVECEVDVSVHEVGVGDYDELMQQRAERPMQTTSAQES